MEDTATTTMDIDGGILHTEDSGFDFKRHPASRPRLAGHVTRPKSKLPADIAVPPALLPHAILRQSFDKSSVLYSHISPSELLPVLPLSCKR